MSVAGKPDTRRRPRQRSRGALAAIGGLLIGSALIRAVTGAGEALAREADPAAPSGQVVTTVDPDTSAAIIRVTEPEFEPLLKALDAREARIEKLESEIAVRMQALTLAETEIDRKLAELTTAEAALRGTLALARSAAEDDITKLTDVYANMKPKQAAALFEEMDPDFAAGFLARMRPDAAAAIMAGLNPRAAYTISVVLAGRNADVPKE